MRNKTEIYCILCVANIYIDKRICECICVWEREKKREKIELLTHETIIHVYKSSLAKRMHEQTSKRYSILNRQFNGVWFALYIGSTWCPITLCMQLILCFCCCFFFCRTFKCIIRTELDNVGARAIASFWRFYNKSNKGWTHRSDGWTFTTMDIYWSTIILHNTNHDNR